ncbi:LamG domain-containing protein, partial [bacterium]|nr:LamG domain-containing protein [bacterium]
MAQNYSLSFDGNGDYIEIADADILSPSSFTIELWVKQPKLTTGRNTYIHKDRGGPTHIEYNFMENAPGIPASQEGLYSYAGFEFLITDTHPPENKWSHIAVTFDSNADLMKIFLNGVSIGSQTITDEVVNTNGKLYIGWHPGDPSYNALTGIIDEVRISKKVRYTSNFTPRTTEFVSDANTIALYHFNEGSGSFVEDVSGYGNDGTIHGATWSIDVPFGQTTDIHALIDDVKSLVSGGSLTRKQGKPLTRKLKSAQRKLKRGKTNSTINKLRSFIRNVERFIAKGKLSLQEGQPLINS